jgi:hypothetical protein
MCPIEVYPSAKKHIDLTAARMRSYGLLALAAATIALLFLCAGALKFPSIEWIELGNDLPAYSTPPPAAKKSTLAAAALVLFLSGGLILALEAQVSRRMPLASEKVRPHLANFATRTTGVRCKLPLLPHANYFCETQTRDPDRRLS